MGTPRSKSVPIQVDDYTLDAGENQMKGSYIEYKGWKGSQSFTVYRFVRSTISNQIFIKDMEAQIEILGSLHNPYIQRLYDIVINKEDLFAFYDYEWFSLSSLIEKNNKIQENVVRQIMFHVLSALKYMHHEHVAHLDISPSSVTFNKFQIAFLSHFFHAQRFDNENSLCERSTGTLNFQPPEVFSGKPFNPFKVDVWSTGVLMLTLLTNTNIFFGNNEEEIINRIINEDPPIEYYISKRAQEVLKACLQKDPNKRATVDELLEMDWIQSQKIRKDVNVQKIESVFTDSTSNKFLLTTNYNVEDSKGRILSAVISLKPKVKYGDNNQDLFLTTRIPEANINITFRQLPTCLLIYFVVYSSSDKESLFQIINSIMDQFSNEQIEK